MSLLDEVAEHRLGDLEVGNDTILEGADRRDVTGGATEHPLGLVTDGENLGRTRLDRDDGGFAKDDSLVFNVNKGVGGSEIDADVAGEKS